MSIAVDVAALVEELGHDGGRIIWPERQEPMCRRGFHIQEIIDLAWTHGWATTPFELFPTVGEAMSDALEVVHFKDDPENNWNRFNTTIDNSMGILMGLGRRCKHAVHYRHGRLWDPDGYTYRYSVEACEEHGFYANELLIFTRQ